MTAPAQAPSAPSAAAAAAALANADDDTGRAHLIVNPHAGRGRLQRWLQAHAQAIARKYPGLQVQAADSADAAQALVAALAPGQRVIVAGGDGSVQRLLAVLRAGGHTLALLPGGHGNDLARALGLHRLRPAAALALAMHGRAQAMDLGQVTPLEPAAPPQCFASSLCAGLDAAIAQRAQAMPALWGLPLPPLLRYLAATLREVVRLQPVHLQLRADGRPLHDGPALFASVLNTATYGAGMRAAPRARLDDGQLDLVLTGAFTRPGVLLMLPRLLAGTHVGHARVRVQPVEVVQVLADRALPLAVDGEARPPARQWRVQVLPQALQVVSAQAQSPR